MGQGREWRYAHADSTSQSMETMADSLASATASYSVLSKYSRTSQGVAALSVAPMHCTTHGWRSVASIATSRRSSARISEPSASSRAWTGGWVGGCWRVGGWVRGWMGGWVGRWEGAWVGAWVDGMDRDPLCSVHGRAMHGMAEVCCGGMPP